MTVRATIRGLSSVVSRFNARACIPLFLIGVGLFVYHNSFSGAFVFDDFFFIVNNPRIRRLWPPWDLLVQARARPLWELSLAINYRLGGLNVWGYHAVNLAIHIVAGLVLFGVVRRTLEGERLRDRYGRAAYGLAGAVAAIWLVHPLQTESVTYICQRAESLMGLLFLLTLYCSIRGSESSRQWAWYGAGIIASALGMATKEVMVTAPLVVLLYDRVFLARSSKEIARRRWGFYLGLAITWSVLGLELARVRVEPASIGADGERVIASWEYLRSQPGVIVHYLRLSFWPHPLVLDYMWHVASTILSVLPWAAIVLALAAGTALAFRCLPSLGFLGAWFFLILGPTSSILPLSDLAFEHRMYLPLAAVVVIGVLLGYESLRLFRGQHRAPDRLRRWLGWGLLVTVVGGFGWTTVRRNDDYRSPLVIWSDTVAKRPENPRAHLNLGYWLAGDGLFSEAIAQYEEALRLNPRFALAHYHLGNALVGSERLDEAMAHYAEALRLKPKFVEAHNNLGKALASRGRFDEAMAQYAEALRLNPKFGLAHYNLADALASRGKIDEAGAHYAEAQRLDPQLVEQQISSGNELADQGKLEEAIAQYSVALRMSPNDVQVHRNLGIALVRQGRVLEAIAHFREALRLAPVAQSHYNLGNALALAGNTEEALEHMRTALKLDPRYELARRELDRLAASGK
jgi:tetratricopeptide (TPR) repeat protein